MTCQPHDDQLLDELRKICPEIDDLGLHTVVLKNPYRY
jgi:hypothetical protein